MMQMRSITFLSSLTLTGQAYCAINSSASGETSRKLRPKERLKLSRNYAARAAMSGSLSLSGGMCRPTTFKR